MVAYETTLHKRQNDTEIDNSIGHRTAFNNEQSPYRKVSYKRPRNDQCKIIQKRKLTYLCTKKLTQYITATNDNH